MRLNWGTRMLHRNVSVKTGPLQDEGNMFKVIIVDDSHTSQTYLKITLDSTKFEIVDTGSDGSELVSLYEKHKPHIVFLDIVMENDGLDALRTLMDIHPEALVIMVTSMSNEKYVNKAFKLGAAGYIVKPYDREKVENVLNAAIKNKTSDLTHKVIK